MKRFFFLQIFKKFDFDKIPSGVTLKGSYHSVPSHDLRQGPLQNDGSILIPREGRGNATKDPFLHVRANAAVASLVIYYDQQETVQIPVPYPWTILMDGNNGAVTDVELLGSWRGINATGAGRHYIARVQGQPIDLGVYIDQTYDIGRMENVHFNPWFSSSQPFMTYVSIDIRYFSLFFKTHTHTHIDSVINSHTVELLFSGVLIGNMFSTRSRLDTQSDIISSKRRLEV